ncbi:MAG: tetratricopeptide repeat protein, partial [Bacteroidales bacterium]|nr:tetratricopeptide repeat protein [Bacteroidales bacterium]
RNEEALSASEKAIELDPDYALAWNNKGAVLVNLGRNEEALSALEKAIELDFNSANAWNIKGNALYGLDRYEEAISAYNKAIEIDPEFAFAWYNKGNVLYILYLNEEALLAYNKAIELDPEDAFAWNNKGIILSKLDRFEEAINAYDKAIEINPEHKSAWNGKEKALRQLGRSSEATDASLRLIYLDLKGYFKDYFLEIEVIMFLIISFILSRNFWKYIIKRKQKKNEQKQALKTERDRIIKKINSFLQPGEQIEDNNPKKEDINQPIWEKHAWEYEDLDPEVSRQIKDISQPDSFELDFNQKIPEKSTNSPEGSKYTGICPVCGSPLVWRRAKKTGELYRGCTNYNGGCRYNDRSH